MPAAVQTLAEVEKSDFTLRSPSCTTSFKHSPRPRTVLQFVRARHARPELPQRARKARRAHRDTAEEGVGEQRPEHLGTPGAEMIGDASNLPVGDLQHAGGVLKL